MNVYFARQAVLDRKSNLVAYELLYRDGIDNSFPDIEPNTATGRLISQTHLSKGIRNLTGGKPALINFSEDSILNGLPLTAPKNDVFVEILESVKPTNEVYEACVKLKEAGYKLVLDDFVYSRPWKKFIPLISLIKIDIISTPLITIAPLIQTLKKSKRIKLLAEKVETAQQHLQALELGFDYFQGYFYFKPEMVSSKDNDIANPVLMELYAISRKSDLCLSKIESVFLKDSGLAYKLLCYTNTGAFPIKQPISNIRQALAYLGDENIRRLISMLVTSILATQKPAELTRLSIARANYCESLAKIVSPQLASEAYLIGMFSLLDAVFDCSMDEVLSKLPVTDLISGVLLSNKEYKKNTLHIILNTVKLLEQGSWHTAKLEAEKVGLGYNMISDALVSSNAWADMCNLDVKFSA